MSLFALSDLHLSLGSAKPMDIFPGWEDHVGRIERNWRTQVGADDYVVVNGDFSWAMSLDEAIADFSFLQSLPGKKLLLKGNHDYWWTTMRKMNSFLDIHGFTSVSMIHNSAQPVGSVCVCGTRGWFVDSAQQETGKIMQREVGRLRTSVEAAVKTGLEPVAFLHYPPVYGSFVCRELLDVLVEGGVKRCYYGHLHARAAANAFEGVYDGIRLRLVSADHAGFAPVRVE